MKKGVNTSIKSLALCAAAGVLGGVLPATSVSAAEPPVRKPNIIMLFADDLGYGDLQCFNPDSKVPTPNLDRLAEQGIRFTNAYCPDAVCSPSRYALMTGRYALRLWDRSGVLANWEGPMIEDGRMTIASLLQQAGYTTGGFGKWHLGATYHTLDGKKPAGQGKFTSKSTGGNLDLGKPIEDGPAERGFDRWWGFVCASESLVFDQDKAVARIDVYEPPAAPGVEQLETIPIAEYLPRTTEKTLEFIREQARLQQEARAAGQEEKPFFAYYSAYVPHIPLAVAEEFKGRTKGGDYGDYVHELDHYIGVILAELDSTGLADNTLVLFASDNGSQFEHGTGEGHRPNGKLRGRKHNIYEGGVRTPFIARWPGQIPANTTSEQLASLTDLIATFAAITGQTLPRNAGEDSFNLLPLMRNPGLDEPIRDHVINRYHRHAIRIGDWKYITAGQNVGTELFNLKEDVGETKNLHDQYPERAAQMKARLEELIAAKRSRLD